MRLAPVLAAAALALSACQAGTTQSGTPPTGTTSTPTGAPTSTTIGSVHRVTLHVTVMPWHLPQPLAREAVSSDGGPEVTVAGGMIAGDASTAAAYTLDVTSGRVTRLPDLAVPVHDTAGWRFAHNPVVIGGGNATEQSAVQELVRNRWRVIGQLPHTRSDLVVDSFDTHAWVIGGYDGSSGAEGDILTSADGRHWTRAGRLPVPVRYGASVVTRGAMWLFGGEVDHVMQTAVQRIDPLTGKATVVARLPHALGHASALLFDDRILVVGGRTSYTTQTGRMWWFDPASDVFTPAGRLPATLTDSAVVVAGRTAYLVGGETPGVSDRVIRLTYM